MKEDKRSNQKLCFDKFDIKFIINSDLHYIALNPRYPKQKGKSRTSRRAKAFFWGGGTYYRLV